MQPIEDRTTLSQRLRLLRVASGMKQEDVAVQLGIGRSAYTYYELSRSKPDYDTLIQLAKMFHVSVDYLVGFSNFPDGSHREAGVGIHLSPACAGAAGGDRAGDGKDAPAEKVNPFKRTAPLKMRGVVLTVKKPAGRKSGFRRKSKATGLASKRSVSAKRPLLLSASTAPCRIHIRRRGRFPCSCGF